MSERHSGGSKVWERAAHTVPSVISHSRPHGGWLVDDVGELSSVLWSSAKAPASGGIVHVYGGSARSASVILASDADIVLRHLFVLDKRIKELERRIQSDQQTIDLRGISDDEALQEVKAHFETHHGEVLYPSEIAEALRLDYEQTVRAMNKLASEGKIAEA